MDILRLNMLAATENDATLHAINGALKAIWTALPAIISADSDGHTATANSAVNLAITNLDGSVTMTAFPPLDMAPVHFPNGGGHSFTHPVKTGDEGMIALMSRAQDLWFQNGGVQDPIDNRAHHLADSRWIPGGRSTPRKLSPAPSTTSAQQRSDNGNHVVDVHKDNGVSHLSTVKVLTNVGGASGSGTVHLPGSILKNAAKVLINCTESAGLPPPGATFANRKIVATLPAGMPGASGAAAGSISSIMGGILSGGIGSLLSSPTAAASGLLMSAVTGASTAINTALGSSGAGVVAALTGAGGLTAALGALETGASALSGATMPAAGAFGLTDVLSHASALSQYFGASVPASVALPQVLSPLNPATLTAMKAQVATLQASTISGALTPAAATSQAIAMTASASAILNNANSAITTLQTAAPLLSLGLLAGSAGMSLDANEASVGAALAGPQLAALTAAMMAAFSPSAADAAAIAAFPDPGGGGATGGF